MNLLLYLSVFYKKVLLNALSFEETSLNPDLFQNGSSKQQVARCCTSTLHFTPRSLTGRTPGLLHSTSETLGAQAAAKSLGVCGAGR